VKYRPDVDGLRAVAVLAVIGYHAFPVFVPGGFVGVDIFFVISGFLISGIIFSGLEQQRFSFRDFYARRIRRIFPALIVVLAAAYAAGWFLLFADRFAELGKHAAGGAGFVANYVLWREAGYFDGASDTKPFLHLWSLGVEEQFYLIWPLAAWLAWKRRFDLLGITLVVFAGSMFLNLDRIRRDLIGTFYSPETRFWELMTGAMLAHVMSMPARWKALDWLRRLYTRLTATAASRSRLSITGAILIAVSIFGIDQSRHFPGRWAVLPVAGAALVIAAGADVWLNRALAARVVVGIGLISYPLYLWHWPLLTFPRLLAGEQPPASWRIAAVAASIALAWATYRFIERPIRFGPRRAFVVPLLCVLMTAIGAAGYYTYRQDGLWSRAVNRSDKASFMSYYQAIRTRGIDGPYRLECDFMQKGTDGVKDQIAPGCTARGRDRTWFLWGDSHAQAWSPGVTSLLPDGVALAQVATSLCRPSFVPIDTEVPGGRCIKANEFAIAKIRELRPEVLILAQAGGHEATDWEALAAEARRLGVRRVVVIGPVPMWIPSLPEVVTSRYWGGNADRVSYGLVPERLVEDERLRQKYASASFDYVSVIGQLCNPEGCEATIPGRSPIELLAFDSAHLTPAASEYLASRLLRPILFRGSGPFP
jgi:peptidoglycan/LPS O-acetylase OafA/YrhL